ncbi:type IV secretion system protein [Bartonella sp. AD13SXNS]|uniref:type IV secretion system protein n=1 Tax=Bartonella sp. AD13SXNS TaxID=3243462 RepID=UPI0035D0915D
MKRILIITGMIMFFEMPSLALAFISQGERVVKQDAPVSMKSTSSPKGNLEIIELLEKQLTEAKAQLHYITQIHQSITGSKTRSSTVKDGDLLLTEPQYIYDVNKEMEIDPKFPQLVADIKKQEEYSANSTHEMRALIDLRSQYASIIDKVVSLQVLEETENRFLQIAQYLMALKDTKDLRAVVEIHTHIKSMHAMIQNEKTKLQMVAHLRNAEQALIHQQKYKRNIKILHHQNKGMPQVKYVSAIQ